MRSILRLILSASLTVSGLLLAASLLTSASYADGTPIGNPVAAINCQGSCKCTVQNNADICSPKQGNANCNGQCSCLADSNTGVKSCYPMAVAS